MEVTATVAALLKFEVDETFEAVAVMIWPAGTVALSVAVKVALPLASVVAVACADEGQALDAGGRGRGRAGVELEGQRGVVRSASR